MDMYSFTVNGIRVETTKKEPLLVFLRQELHLYSVKDGCSEGACGACMVLVNDEPVRSCVLTTELASGRTITTVEGLTDREKDAFVYAFGHCGAVQCGFCTPGMVISAAGLLRRVPNPSEDEVKEALRGNLCRCTGYKKILEAVQMAAAILRGDLVMEPASVETGVGKKTVRVDVRRKVLGYGKYPDDIGPEYFVPEHGERAEEVKKLCHLESLHSGMVLANPEDPGCSLFEVVDDGTPSMAYGSAVRARYPRARVVSIDASAALALPGVLAVFTAKDVPVNKVGHIRRDWDVMIAVGDCTRCVGDAIALVVAESPEVLEKAKRLVKVSYEVLTPVRNIHEAMDPSAPKIHEGGNLCEQRHVVRGDAKEALAHAAYTATASFKTPFTEHAFLEPECAVALPYGDGVKVLSSDQGAFDTRREILAMFHWEDTPDRVVVENQLIGGGFGGKEDVSVQHLAALAAYRLHRPVKVKLTRQESINFHPKRHAMEAVFTVGCDENGILTGLDCEIHLDTGAYASLCGPVLERACTHAVGPYVYQNTDIRGYGWYTDNPPAGAFRGFGVTQSEYALESLLNVLAAKAGLSPWEIRYRNAIEPGKVLPNGQIADASTALKETLLAVKPYFDANPGRCGIACAMKNAGVGVGLPDHGRVKIVVENHQAVVYAAASDIGQGCLTVFTQDLAEATGLPMTAIRIGLANTQNAPDSGTTSGSRQTLLTGEAVRGAAFLLRDALLAAERSEESGESIDAILRNTEGYRHPRQNSNTSAAYGTAVTFAPVPVDGFVSPAFAIEADGTISAHGTGLDQGTYGSAGTQSAIHGSPVKDVMGALSLLEGRVFTYDYFEPTDKLGADVPNPKSHVAYAYATNVAVLDENGRVSDLYAAYDAGKVVNPLSIQGQIEGGVLMSMGYALTEDFPLKDCVPQAKFGTLGLLRSTDIPRIHAITVEKEELLGTAYGSKGIGEITSIPAAPAIGGAYYARDGKLRTSLPMEDTYYRKGDHGTDRGRN